MSTPATNRLASFNSLLAFLKGGKTAITPAAESYAALQTILDSASAAIGNYCLPSTFLSLLQQSVTETFGIEHYGRHARNQIRLGLPPIASVASVTDNLPLGGSLLDPSEYVVDPRSGILTRIHGKFYCGPQAVQVVYTGGYAPNGQTGDDYALNVPNDLAMAALEQAAYEFSLREPGGAFYGVSSMSRPDGSLVSSVEKNLLPQVKALLAPYRMKEFW